MRYQYCRGLAVDPLVRIGLRAARQSRQHLLSTYDRPPASRLGRHALVSYSARIRESLFRAYQLAIQSTYPNHSVVPHTADFKTTSYHSWLVQPLDGETNFLRSLDDFCAVIGIYEGRDLRHSIVYDYLQDDEYYATHDIGAIVNQNRLRVSKIDMLSESLVATAEPDTSLREGNAQTSGINALLVALSQGIRTSGSIGLDLARVARGKLDAFVSVGSPNLTARVAGLLVVEAGGFASEIKDYVSREQNSLFVAANPKLYSTISSLMVRKLGKAVQMPNAQSK